MDILKNKLMIGFVLFMLGFVFFDSFMSVKYQEKIDTKENSKIVMKYNNI